MIIGATANRPTKPTQATPNSVPCLKHLLEPVPGVGGDLVHIDAEMKVGTVGSAGLTNLSQLLTLHQMIAFLDGDRLQVNIEGDNPLPMIDGDNVAVKLETFASQNDGTVAARPNRRASRSGKVQAGVKVVGQKAAVYHPFDTKQSGGPIF